MKCPKCGNEIKDNVKYCSKCGEKIEKVKYCPKCGNELQPNTSFCRRCGANVEMINGSMHKESKPVKFKDKKIYAAVGIFAILIIGIVSFYCIYINSDTARYKAFIEFQQEFCDEHDDYADLNNGTGKIIMAPGNEKWLALYDISDVKYYDEDEEVEIRSISDKVHLYKYSWGKVSKVTSFSRESLEHDCIFSLIDNKLYLFTNHCGIEDNKVNGIYVLNDKNKFDKIKVKVRGDDIRKYKVIDTDYTFEEFCFLGNALFLSDQYYYWNNNPVMQAWVVNSLISTAVDDFEDIVSALSEYKTKDQISLQIAYGNVYNDNNVMYMDEAFHSNYPVVGTMDTDDGFYYIRTSQKAGLWKIKNADDYKNAMKKAGKYKVTRIEGECFSDIEAPENISVPDNINYIGYGAFWGQEKIESVKLPNGVTKICREAFEECSNLCEINIPESIEFIGYRAFAGCPNLIQVEIPETIDFIAKSAFKLGDSYIFDNFITIVGKSGTYIEDYAEENGYKFSDKKLGKKEIEEMNNIFDALIAYDDFRNSDECDGDIDYYSRKVSLFYCDDDNIPECILWYSLGNGDFMHTEFWVLSYKNGKLLKEKCTSYDSGYSYFRYRPKSGEYIYAEGQHSGIWYAYYNLTDRFKLKEEISDVQTLYESFYTINDIDVGSHQAVQKHIDALNLNVGFTEDDLCYDVAEAYERLID